MELINQCAAKFAEDGGQFRLLVRVTILSQKNAFDAITDH
jgi:hypothetical protein